MNRASVRRGGPAAALLLVLLAAAVAGCMGAKGPNASSSTPGAHAPTDTGSTTSSSTPATTRPGNGLLVRPAHIDNLTDGFAITGDETVSGFMPPGNVTATFVVTNVGPDGQILRDPCGDGNPRLRIEDANGTVLALTPPLAHCAAIAQFGPFAHNATLGRSLTWNGTAYQGFTPYTVAAGRYEVVATFAVQRGSTSEDIVVRLPVNVLAQGSRGVL